MGLFAIKVEHWRQTYFKVVAGRSLDLVEGERVEAVVEVFRMSEEEVAAREPMLFVHEKMSTFRRSWVQLMDKAFRVWVFSTYNGKPSGSAAGKLEHLEEYACEDDRFVAAYKVWCDVEFLLRHCGATYPADVEFEFNIQRESEKPDLKKMRDEMDIDDEIRILDELLLDSSVEPKLPEPHVHKLPGVVRRPFTITPETVQPEDQCVVNVSLRIANEHASRTLCVCDVYFTLDSREPNAPKPLEEQFKWRWLCREPTPYEIPPGDAWVLNMEISAELEGNEGRDLESPFYVAYNWKEGDTHLGIYAGIHTIPWRAPKSSVEEARKPVYDMTKPHPYAGAFPMRPPDPPPPVQDPSFEVPEENEIVRIRRVFTGPVDPETGLRIF